MDFCTCKKTAAEATSLAIASVPMQPWETPYNQETALKQGTIFPALDMPFYVTDEKKGGGARG